MPSDPAADAPHGGAARVDARVDAHALARHLRRRAAAPQPPWLHGEVAHRMGERLALIRQRPARVIDWWARQGASAEVLARHCPGAARIAVEPVGALPAPPPSRWRLPWQAAPAAPLADDAAPPQPASLLWANMMLHWAEPLPALLQRWHAALAVDGFLMFSCLGPDTLKELRALYAGLGWPSPGSRFIDMHDLGDALVHAGFADPVMDMEMLTLTWDSAEALLAELRTLGCNTDPQRAAGLRTPRWRERLAQQLTQRLADEGGRLRLTFEVIYGHAFRPAPRAAVAAQTEISLDTMRSLVRQRGKPQRHPPG